MIESAVLEEEVEVLRMIQPLAVRIAAIADTHGLSFSCPEADVFIHAGDMTNWGEWAETAAVGRSLGEEGYQTVILVPGNHDNALEQYPRAELFPFLPNTRLLIDKAWEFRGLVFYGSPWTPFFNGVNPRWMAFMRTEDELRRLFSNMPAEVDVLITHGPPKGILDHNSGSEALREAIEKRIIRKHIFGHIHEEGGKSLPMVQRDGSIRTSYNVSVITTQPKPSTQAPLVIDL